MAPNIADDWIIVAKERAADAEAILLSRKDSVGPVYMVGYAIECSLKAYLRSRNTPFPHSGGEGHNLKRLWRACGFRLNQLRDNTGHKTFFIQSWNTAWRYEQRLPVKGFSSSELVKSGKSLAGWIQKQVRQKRRRGQ